MNKYERLKEKFDNREKIVGANMMFIHNTLLLEKMAERDLDFILFDTEHGFFDTCNLIPCLQVMRLLGVPSFVRVQDSEYHLVAKIMDLGADGVMIPRVETIEQMEKVVGGLLFAPDGRKEIGGHGQMRKGESFFDYAKTRFLLPQVESPKGVENLPAILDTYGKYINAVIIGPNDLAIMSGTPCRYKSEETTAWIKKTFDICEAYGKSVGIFCVNAEDAKFYRDMGANVLWMGIDRDYFLQGFNRLFDGVESL